MLSPEFKSFYSIQYQSFYNKKICVGQTRLSILVQGFLLFSDFCDSLSLSNAQLHAVYRQGFSPAMRNKPPIFPLSLSQVKSLPNFPRVCIWKILEMPSVRGNFRIFRRGRTTDRGLLMSQSGNNR